MTICRTCGVELDDDMTECPLCANLEKDEMPRLRISKSTPAFELGTSLSGDTGLMHRILWQITGVLLVSGIISTVVINLSYKGMITWSIYPLSICLILLSYASVMILTNMKMFFRMFVAWSISVIILVLIYMTLDIKWPLQLALPILSLVTGTGLTMAYCIKQFQYKGITVLAVALVAIAITCLATEAIILMYLEEPVQLQWSVVVAACLLPVTAAILFMHFRLRNNRNLQKIFHT